MNSKLKFTYLLALCLGLFVISCDSDDDMNPCEGITCDAGFECVNGTCEEILNTISGELTADATWTADQVWVLAGKVIVPAGITLTIAPGTIVKGAEGSESAASALIVARGGKINATGTASSPIIFTSILDDIQVGQTAGTNLTNTDNEKWGGIILLGDAPISAKDGDTEANIEGIPADAGYGKYGGNNASDNSGTLKYVSIRHGGITIGDGNEINGLTLGGVGSGTVLDHVEVFATLDDGVEFFGGTVNASNIVVAYQGDDGVDIDQNYSGTVDNFVVVQGGSDTDEALEIDGPEGSTYTTGKFTLTNGTLIASDTDNTSGADLKSKAQGNITNCVWKGYSRFVKIRASYVDAGCADASDAWTRVQDNSLVISNCDVEGTIGAEEVAKVYVDDEDSGAIACLANQTAEKEAVVDGMIGVNGNAIVGSSSRGANTSVLSWTLAATSGYLN